MRQSVRPIDFEASPSHACTPTELLDAVSNATNDAIFVKDLQGRYLFVNRRCARWLGASPDQIVGTTDDPWFGPEIATRLRDYDRQIVASGVAKNEDEELLLDGERRTFSTTKAPWVAADGRVLGVVGVARDVTAKRVEQRALQAERDRYATIADVLPGAFASFRRGPDGAMTVPFSTARIEELCGATPPQLALDAGVLRERMHPDDWPQVEQLLEESARALVPLRAHFRVAHPTRGERWVKAIAEPRREEDGGTRWNGVLLDVTERQRAQLELLKQKAQLELVAATSPGAICSFRMSATGEVSFPYLSPAMRHIYGVPAEDIARDAQAALGRVHPEDRERMTETIARSLATMQPWRCEYRVLNAERGEVWIEGHSKPSREPDGSTIWHGVLADITERRTSEARLRTSEATLRAVVETVPDFLLLIGSDGKIQFINHLLPGFETDDVVGADVQAFIAPFMREGVDEAIRLVRETRQMCVHEAVAVTPHGEQRWYNTRIGPVVQDGEVTAIAVAATDITERRVAENALRASEERYRSLVELLPDPLFVGTAGKLSFCNAAFLRLMGATSREQLYGMTAFQLFAPEEHAELRQRLSQLESGELPSLPQERTLISLDGSRRLVSAVAAPLRDGSGDVIVVLHDLTERQRTEQLLRSVLESVNDALITIDRHGVVLSCNPATSRLFGYESGEIVGQRVNLLMPAAQAAEHDQYLERYLSGGEARIIGKGRELLGRHKDGSSFPIELSVTEFALHGERHFTGVIRDISARKKLEDQFRQAHKMEAFGQLAGGVAHDFNNLLTVILGASETLVSAFSHAAELPADEVRDYLSEIHDAGQRAAALTRQLLAFSRKSVMERKVIDINTIVRDTERILRRLIGEDIALSTKLAADLEHVEVDPGQLSQVLMNLAVNARDAMPTGGRLEIETTNVQRDGEFVCIVVRDTGAGMSEEVLANLFQPFFTTKGVGKGTGLGLAVVHGIVMQSGGKLEVSSRLGQGTVFEILLPTALAARAPAGTEVPIAEGHGAGTVLLVEDDDAVRRLATRALAQSGYRVVAAHDGLAAVKLIEQGLAIDVLVTDVVMPTLDGRQVADELRKRSPHARILFVSGYTDDMLVHRGVQSEDVDFLAKPYTPASLLQALRKVVAKGS